MAKANGLLGNFSGKVGNVVGYNLKDSNNKQTQGVRAYQPVVSNPRTAAQAEQRAKMAAVNATYRALKPIIDRGFEGVPYGAKSRAKFLSLAMKNFSGPWVEKDEIIPSYMLCQISQGSLGQLSFVPNAVDQIIVLNAGAEDMNDLDWGNASDAFKTAFPFLQNGDQLTLVAWFNEEVAFASRIIDSSSEENAPSAFITNGQLHFEPELFGLDITIAAPGGYTLIASREGADGKHLRSTSFLYPAEDTLEWGEYTDTGKQAAIRSYMNSGQNTDWPVEQQ